MTTEEFKNEQASILHVLAMLSAVEEELHHIHLPESVWDAYDDLVNVLQVRDSEIEECLDEGD